MNKFGRLLLIFLSTIAFADIFVCENVETLKNSVYSENDIVKTLGYYIPDDGGGAEYIIKSNGGDFPIGNDLYAVLRTKNPINVNQMGILPISTLSSTVDIGQIDSLWENVLSTHKSVYIPNGTYWVSNTLYPQDSTTIKGESKTGTIIQMLPTNNPEKQNDIDLMVIGWDCTLQDFTLSQNENYPHGTGTKGTLRMQSFTHKDVITNNWQSPEIGGLAYKNHLKNIECHNGQNYNIFIVNAAYTKLDNVRAIKSYGPAGNLYIWGKGGNPISTTVTIEGGHYGTAFNGGTGITLKKCQTTAINGTTIEGNSGRGILIDSCVNIMINGVYLENNFLNAPQGDGDIVVTNSNLVHINTPLILGNNSSYGVKAYNTTYSVLQGGHISGQGGTYKEVDIDGWQYSKIPYAIHETREEGDWKWTKYSDGSAIISISRDFSGVNLTAPKGNMFISNSPITISDFPFNFITTSDLGYKMEVSYSLTAADNQFLWPVTTGMESPNNAIRFRVCSPLSLESASFTVNAIIKTYWK